MKMRKNNFLRVHFSHRKQKLTVKNSKLANSVIVLSFNDQEESIEESPYGGKNDNVS